MGRDKARTVLYTVAGVYLVYLAYNLSQDLGTVTGREKILVGAFMVLFGVTGIGIAIWGIYKMIQQAREPGEEAAEESQEEQEQVEPAEATQEET